MAESSLASYSPDQIRRQPSSSCSPGWRWLSSSDAMGPGLQVGVSPERIVKAFDRP